MYDRSMDFEWDEAKNQTNVHKNGIEFDTARRIFEGTVATSADHRQDDREEHHITLARWDRPR